MHKPFVSRHTLKLKMRPHTCVQSKLDLTRQGHCKTTITAFCIWIIIERHNWFTKQRGTSPHFAWKLQLQRGTAQSQMSVHKRNSETNNPRAHTALQALPLESGMPRPQMEGQRDPAHPVSALESDVDLESDVVRPQSAFEGGAGLGSHVAHPQSV